MARQDDPACACDSRRSGHCIFKRGVPPDRCRVICQIPQIHLVCNSGDRRNLADHFPDTRTVERPEKNHLGFRSRMPRSRNLPFVWISPSRTATRICFAHGLPGMHRFLASDRPRTAERSDETKLNCLFSKSLHKLQPLRPFLRRRFPHLIKDSLLHWTHAAELQDRRRHGVSRC